MPKKADIELKEEKESKEEPKQEEKSNEKSENDTEQNGSSEEEFMSRSNAYPLFSCYDILYSVHVKGKKICVRRFRFENTQNGECCMFVWRKRVVNF